MIDRGVIRMALIVLIGVSFTYFILWWIMRGHL
jgi:phage shock protein PspC (stress-responsive transcriptional regulator)